MEDSTKAAIFGFIRDGKVYLKGFLDFPERQIGEVKDTEEAALTYFEQRFEIIKNKVEGLIKDIDEAQNKGSFLMKLLHLREQLTRFDAIGDFAPLYEQLVKKEEEIQSLIAKNREKNLEIKRALVEEARQFEESVDWKDGAEKLKELKAKWLKTGAVEKEHEEETEGQFNAILDNFFSRRKAFFEDRSKMQAEKVEQCEKLIAKAEGLLAAGTTYGLDAQVKTLQEEWKALGTLPSAQSNELWERFKKAKDSLVKLSKRNRNTKGKKPGGARPEFLQTNLRIKQQLCDEATALSEMPLAEAVDKAKVLQAKWKETGPVPDENRRDLTNTFTLACDRIFELNYLMRVVTSKNYTYKSKPEREQVLTQINVLRDLIRKDEGELAIFENNFGALTISDQNQPMNKLLHSKLNSQKRKLQVKQMLLAELQDKLKNL